MFLIELQVFEKTAEKMVTFIERFIELLKR